jgi:hypothetical protein
MQADVGRSADRRLSGAEKGVGQVYADGAGRGARAYMDGRSYGLDVAVSLAFP